MRLCRQIGKGDGHIGSYIELGYDHRNADNESPHDITVCRDDDHDHHGHHVGQVADRDELDAGEHKGKDESYRHKKEPAHDNGRIAHDDGVVKPHISLADGWKLLLHEFLHAFGDRYQSGREYSAHGRKDQYDRRYREGQLKDISDIKPRADPQHNTEHKADNDRLAGKSELVFKRNGIGLELIDDRSFIKNRVSDDSRRIIAADRKGGDRDTRKLRVPFDMRRAPFGDFQDNDLGRNDRGYCDVNIAGGRADERADHQEVPVIPDIDIHDFCQFEKEHKDIDEHDHKNHDRGQAERPGDRRKRRPADIEHVHRQSGPHDKGLDRGTDFGHKEIKSNENPDEPDPDIEGRLNRCREFKAEDHREDEDKDRQHHINFKTEDIGNDGIDGLHDGFPC